jgi:cytochrome P450
MSPWVVQRDPRFFPRPAAFEPERWADGMARTLPRYAYFPFGGGPRVCIGSGFAMTEGVLLLATIARRFRASPVPGHPVTPRASITLRPEHGVPMVLHRR